MARKAAADNIVRIAPSGPRFQPPKILKAGEKELFLLLVEHNPHLTVTDVPMLVLYCQQMIRAQKSGNMGYARLAISLARSLRLTARSASSPDRVGRDRIKDNHASELRDFRVDDEDEEDEAG